MKHLAILFLLAFASIAGAQDAKDKPMPEKPVRITTPFVAAKAGELITIPGGTAKSIVWVYDERAFDAKHSRQFGPDLVLVTSTNGIYQVTLVADGMKEVVVVTVTGGGPTPIDPPAPVDPMEALKFEVKALTVALGKAQVENKTEFTALWEALKSPRPPPGPTPDPAPIPLPGFRVLIIYDSTITPEQDSGIMGGKKVRDYLQSHCVVGADGKTKDFWILQAGLDVSAAPKWIGDVIQRHPGQRNYMVVSDGKTGYDGAIPANANEALKILTKIGGP